MKPYPVGEGFVQRLERRISREGLKLTYDVPRRRPLQDMPNLKRRIETEEEQRAELREVLDESQEKD